MRVIENVYLIKSNHFTGFSHVFLKHKADIVLHHLKLTNPPFPNLGISHIVRQTAFPAASRWPDRVCVDPGVLAVC